MAYARGETDHAPLWMSVLAFAQQSGQHPQRVGAETNALWWQRWHMGEKVKAARQAVEHGKVAKDWTKELSERERELIHWAETTED